MKGVSGISELFGKKGVGRINGDLIVFAFFLFLSFLFWYLNSLGKVTESEIKYPVRYINLPKGRVLLDDLPSKLDIYVKGPGYSVLKLKLEGDRVPVVLDISSISYRRVTGSKGMKYYVKTASLAPILSGTFGPECAITSIKPDTLFFAFDKIISRNLPVVPDIAISTERQYFVRGSIVVDPDSVKVTGPSHLLDTMNFISTEYRKFNGLNRTVKRTLDILAPKQFTLSGKRATVTILVEQFTEAEANVQVKILNQPGSMELRIFPDRVKVTGLVAVSDYQKFRDMPFDVVLDLAKADLVSDKRIPLEVRNVPSFINSLRLSPPDVDFLIEKKAR